MLVTGTDVIIQLYIFMPAAGWCLDRPLKELKGFQKMSVKSGETICVSSVPDKDAFSFYTFLHLGPCAGSR